MQLYRYNLIVSHELFKLISCFEVSLRNKIDGILKDHLGPDWLRDSILPNGAFFHDKRVIGTRKIVTNAYEQLLRNQNYSHSRLLSQMEFGVWKYMYNNVQYRLTQRLLLNVFPKKPRSSQNIRIGNTYIFNELNGINNIRNRIAHHEPICFGRGAVIDTSFVLECYRKMIKLFQWMGIDSHSLLYGLDHVSKVCKKINDFKYAK